MSPSPSSTHHHAPTRTHRSSESTTPHQVPRLHFLFPRFRSPRPIFFIPQRPLISSSTSPTSTSLRIPYPHVHNLRSNSQFTLYPYLHVPLHIIKLPSLSSPIPTSPSSFFPTPSPTFPQHTPSPTHPRCLVSNSTRLQFLMSLNCLPSVTLSRLHVTHPHIPIFSAPPRHIILRSTFPSLTSLPLPFLTLHTFTLPTLLYPISDVLMSIPYA